MTKSLFLGFIGPSDDAQLQTVAARAVAAGHRVAYIDWRFLLQPASLVVREQQAQLFWHMYGAQIPQCDVYWLYRVPKPVAQLAPPSTQMTAQEWYAKAKAHEARYQTFVAWLLQIENKKIPIVNTFSKIDKCENKLHQLDVLKQKKIPTPETYVSNNVDGILDFFQKYARTVVKPLLGGAYARAFTADSLQNQQQHDEILLLQEYHAGKDLRVYVVNGAVIKIYEIVRQEGEDEMIDIRACPSYQNADIGQLPCRDCTHALQTSKIIKACIDAALVCGYDFAGIDLKYIDEENWVILELNASPKFIDVEQSAYFFEHSSEGHQDQSAKYPVTDALLAFMQAVYAKSEDEKML